jgi:hypothetical protein
VSSLLSPLELSPPYSVEGTTSSTAGTPTPISIRGNVFELVVWNRSADHDLYVSLDLGSTWVRIPADSMATFFLGSFPDPLILVRSDGASQPYTVYYRLRL